MLGGTQSAGPAASMKRDPYGDPADYDGDARGAVSPRWSAPTANLGMGGRNRQVGGKSSFVVDKPADAPVPMPPNATDADHSPAGALGQQVRAHPSYRPRSATIARPHSARRLPKQYSHHNADKHEGAEAANGSHKGSGERAPPDLVADSRPVRDGTNSPRAGPPQVNPCRPTSAASKTIDIARTAGRNAPLPGYFAALGAPTAATVAQAEAALLEAASSQSKHRLSTQTRAAAARDAASDIPVARKRAILKHGRPFAWLKTFDRTADPTSRHAPSPRLGDGAPRLYGLKRSEDERRARERRASRTGSEPREPKPVAKAPPRPFGYRDLQRNLKRDATTACGPSDTNAKPITDFHAGTPSGQPRRDLCGVDMARASARPSGIRSDGQGSGGPLALEAAERALRRTQRHTATPRLDSRSQRPPLNPSSPSRGLSLNIKHTLVEPSIVSPRFATAVDNRPRPPSA